MHLLRDLSNGSALRIALVGNHPPRRCGIATYTRDVACALRAAGHAVHVTAMTEPRAAHDYGPAVDVVVRHDERPDYAAAGRAIARWTPHVMLVQHEFGIFGGPAGVWLTDLVDLAAVPLVVQLHTILTRPDHHQKIAMDALRRRASGLVVMAELGRSILAGAGTDGPGIEVIPHGTPDRPLADVTEMRQRLGWPARPTLLTFGLLSPGKGIETAIAALPHILDRVPNARYVLLGATHPALLASQGEGYRIGLIAEARRLGVEHALDMQNCYVDDNHLCDALQASDVYVTPYLKREQITSGTLAYALACGVPAVSTPYWHAEEVLAPEFLFPFGDAAALAATAVPLLSRTYLRNSISRRLWDANRSTIWPVNARRLTAVLSAAATGADVSSVAAE
jgi:glycosyltransferase involved in cell wall biosynthesis